MQKIHWNLHLNPHNRVYVKNWIARLNLAVVDVDWFPSALSGPNARIENYWAFWQRCNRNDAILARARARRRKEHVPELLNFAGRRRRRAWRGHLRERATVNNLAKILNGKVKARWNPNPFRSRYSKRRHYVGISTSGYKMQIKMSLLDLLYEICSFLCQHKKLKRLFWKGDESIFFLSWVFGGKVTHFRIRSSFSCLLKNHFPELTPSRKNGLNFPRVFVGTSCCSLYSASSVF